MEGADLSYYFSFLKEQLKASGNEYINTTARCLQMMLRIDEYRHAFIAIDGITRYFIHLFASTVSSCLSPMLPQAYGNINALGVG